MTEKESDFYTIALEESHDLIQSEISINSQSGLAATIFMSLAIDPLYEGMKDDAESILRNANNVPISGFLNLLIAKCEKWGGSHDEMFSVVTQFYDEDRPGSAALVARAHCERLLYMAHFESLNDNQIENYTNYAKKNLLVTSDMVLNSKKTIDAEIRLSHTYLAFTLPLFGLYKQYSKHIKILNGFHDEQLWSLMPRSKLLKIYWGFLSLFKS